MSAKRLAETTHLPRVFGYLLAILLLSQLNDETTYVTGWMLAMLVYPQLLRYLLHQQGDRRGLASVVMSTDALLTGLLVSLVDFNLEAGVVLVSLLSISVLVVGGIRLWCLLLPVCLAGMFAGAYLHPSRFVGDESFYFVSFICLVAYVCFIGLLVYQEAVTLRQMQVEASDDRRKLQTFRRFVSPFVTARIAEGQLPDESAYVRKRLTVFFSDLEGFTHLMDTADETLVAGMLNEYFAIMSESAEQHGGAINKFLGDGFLVFFGDSDRQDVTADALACVRMSLDMRDRFQHLSEYWRCRVGQPLYQRMGIHTGYCLLGEFGCENRKDYTALGSTVNLASRLENNADRGEILVSMDTWKLLRNCVDFGPELSFQVKGFDHVIRAYGVRALLQDGNKDGQVRLLS